MTPTTRWKLYLFLSTHLLTGKCLVYIYISNTLLLGQLGDSSVHCQAKFPGGNTTAIHDWSVSMLLSSVSYLFTLFCCRVVKLKMYYALE